MDLIPVIDLKQGQVVRGRGGNRDQYRPNHSRLLASTNPLRTCRVLLDCFHPPAIYVADLDGILTGEVQYDVLGQLVSTGVELVVDAGVQSLEKGHRLLELGIQRLIVPLETLPALDLIADFIGEFGEERILFSLDLRDGRPIGPCVRDLQSLEIAQQALESGVHHLIVLDVAAVGRQRGVPTLSLCHSIKNRWPDLVLWTGGGVRSIVDLHALSIARVDGALVASALHDGAITPADWQGFLSLSDEKILRAIDA